MSQRAVDFDYPLDREAIAQTPAEPRDSARLLEVSRLRDHRFADLPDLLAPGDLVVVNDTRVRAARLLGRRLPGGGAVEALLLDRHEDGRWETLVKPARKVRAGQQLVFGNITAEVVSDPVEGRTFLRLEAPEEIEEAIEKQGEVPLPPYIRRELADPSRYQTVYATEPGSAAAPTAGLHFTPSVLARLQAGGIVRARVELRVGMGTFRPITVDHLDDHRMHPEWVSVPAATVAAVARTKERGGSVVAVGTTVVRALESQALDGHLRPGSGFTDLFIRPGHSFRVVDRLVTNFHAPRSSLVVLIAAFMGPDWRLAYRKAVERGYRFLSFGDAMLADRAGDDRP